MTDPLDFPCDKREVLSSMYEEKFNLLVRYAKTTMELINEIIMELSQRIVKNLEPDRKLRNQIL